MATGSNWKAFIEWWCNKSHKISNEQLLTQVEKFALDKTMKFIIKSNLTNQFN